MNLPGNILQGIHYFQRPILLEESLLVFTQGPSLFHRYLEVLKTDPTLSSDLIKQIHPPEILCHSNKWLKAYKMVLINAEDPLFSRIRATITLLQTSIFSSPQSEEAAQAIRELYRSYIQQVCNSVGKEKMSLLKGPVYLLGTDQGTLLLDRKIALAFVSLNSYEQSDASYFAESSTVRRVGEIYFKAVGSKPLDLETSSSSSQDIQGNLYLQFEKAYESFDFLKQIFCLEKMAADCCEKNQWIQAAHLLNAALALTQKHSFNPKYQKHLFSKLEDLEKCFLEKLGITSADHREYLEDYRHQLAEIRKGVTAQIEQGFPANEILEELTQSYRKLLENVIHSSIMLLSQKPPCSFAMIGLGSMARKEMCPYSDVEFAILIEKNTPKTHGYFTLLSQFLELRITNMGETKWPFIRSKRQLDGKVSEAMSLTPGGFSMDIGGLSPLGKEGVYELIGTPKELAAYQNPLWLEKHEGEIILVNALTQVTWIMGDKKLVRLYEAKVKKWLYPQPRLFRKRKKQIGKERALDLLRGHLEEFKPYLADDRIDIRAFDIKKDFYRPLQMAIGSLLQYYGYNKEQGVMAGIIKLETKKIISSTGASQLKQTLNQILSLRARVHLFYQKEQEIIYRSRGEEDTSSKALCLINSEGLKAIFEIYRVLIPFHEAMKKFVEDPTSSVLETADFYDADVGIVIKYEDNPLRYREAAAEYAQAAALDPENPDALDNLLLIKNELGDAQKSLEYGQEQLRILKAIHGDIPHPDIARCINFIGLALSSLGKHEEALAYQQQALELCREVFGEEHSDVASALINVGVTFSKLGRYEEALTYKQQALKLNKKIFGEKHLEVAIALGNVGKTLADLGRYEEALFYQQQALELFKEVFGEKHPKIATVLNNIGSTLGALERYEEALIYQKQALELAKELFGDKHPSVAKDLNNVGTSLNALGRYEEAFTYQKQALGLSKELFGEKHPDVATNLNNLGLILSRLEKYQEALSYHQQALELDKELFGDKHPSVAKDLNNIGGILDKLERREEALTYIQQALELGKEIFGEQHPLIATNLNNGGLLLCKLGKYEEALIHHQQALKLEKEIFGKKHVNVATSLNYVGTALDKLGRCEEALIYHQQAFDLRKEIFGEKHPSVVIGLKDMGLISCKLGKYEEALIYQKQALEIEKEIFGEKHSDVVTSLVYVGSTLSSLERYEEALIYYKQAFECVKELVGEKHSYVAASLDFVGKTLSKLEKYEEALIYYKQALEIKKEIFGGKHSSVVTSLGNVRSTLEKLGKYEEALIYQ